MRKLGYVFIAIGLALLLFVLYSFIKDTRRIRSPVPDDEGVKVIFITPTE